MSPYLLWPLVGLAIFCALVTWLVLLLSFIAWIGSRVGRQSFTPAQEARALERLAEGIRSEVWRQPRRKPGEPPLSELESRRPPLEDWDGPS